MINFREYFNNVIMVKHNELLVYTTTLKHDQVIDKLDDIIQDFNDNIIYNLSIKFILTDLKNNLNDLTIFFKCDYIERLIIKDLENDIEYLLNQLKGVK